MSLCPPSGMELQYATRNLFGSMCGHVSFMLNEAGLREFLVYGTHLQGHWVTRLYARLCQQAEDFSFQIKEQIEETIKKEEKKKEILFRGFT